MFTPLPFANEMLALCIAKRVLADDKDGPGISIDGSKPLCEIRESDSTFQYPVWEVSRNETHAVLREDWSSICNSYAFRSLNLPPRSNSSSLSPDLAYIWSPLAHSRTPRTGWLVLLGTAPISTQHTAQYCLRSPYTATSRLSVCRL